MRLPVAGTRCIVHASPPRLGCYPTHYRCIVPTSDDFIIEGDPNNKKTSVRPVTIEGQKFEIHQDPSQTLPERLWTQFGRLFFSTFQNSGTKRFLAAIMANIGLRNSQEGLGLDAAQFRVPHPLRSTKSTTAS